MTAFIAAALGEDRLYRSADRLDALQIIAFEPGDELGWHFDRSAGACAAPTGVAPTP
jgi:alkylated DNA repair dioxygenase AlkB